MYVRNTVRHWLVGGFAMPAAIAVLLGFAFTAWSAAARAEVHPAQALLEEKTEYFRMLLQKDRDAFEADPSLLRDLIKDEVLPHFDFQTMSKRVLGKHWRKASDEQRGAFVKQFRSLLVRTYSTSLLEYADLPIEYLDTQERDDGAKAKVMAAVQLSDGKNVPIDYELYKKSEWKVYDVAINGVSLVINYRSSFASEIRKNTLDGLIATLSQRNENP